MGLKFIFFKSNKYSSKSNLFNIIETFNFQLNNDRKTLKQFHFLSKIVLKIHTYIEININY
jgi:hypothetical protein